MSAKRGGQRRALITGIAGQDGSYLAELLLAEGYEVHGIDLPVPVKEREHKLRNLDPVIDRVHLHFLSLQDAAALAAVVATVRPDECYHLAASSFVSFAFEDEGAVLRNNIEGLHGLLGALKSEAPECRLFFAGSSEMFGTVAQAPQDESTDLNPRSVYGISKVAGHHLIRYYRDHHDLFCCTGILYNHESPRRGLSFVTRKITSAAAKICLGLEGKLYLGNLDAVRDWGYAPDFVRAMWLMLQQETPADYVIAGGTTHSVREFAEIAFRHLGLDYRDHVEVDQRFYRENEPVPLCGDPRRAIGELDWRPAKSFEEMVIEMVEHDIKVFSSAS